MVTIEQLIISNLVTLALSLVTLIFATGRTYGEVKKDIAEIKHDIAQIQGMFITRVRSDRVDKGD